MQSLFQYRRLRRDVQENLGVPGRPSDTPASTLSIPTSEHKEQKLKDEEPKEEESQGEKFRKIDPCARHYRVASGRGRR